MLTRFTEQQQAVCAVLLEDGGDRVLMPSATEVSCDRGTGENTKAI